MRKTLIAAVAAVLAVSGIAWAANQVATDTFRKVLAVELFSSNAAIGVDGTPLIAHHAPVASMLRGANTSTGTGATTFTGMGAQGVGIKIYVASVQCGRTDAGTSPIVVTLNDTASTPIVVPNAGNGGGNNPPYLIPLVVAANTALTFTSGTGVSTVYCSAQGYKGS